MGPTRHWRWRGIRTSPSGTDRAGNGASPGPSRRSPANLGDCRRWGQTGPYREGDGSLHPRPARAGTRVPHPCSAGSRSGPGPSAHGSGSYPPRHTALDTDPLGTPLWCVPSDDRLRDLSRLPLVVAPMAGGPTTPMLVRAAADAGAMGMLAAGYKTAAEMQAEIATVRSATSAAFGVNVFVPGEAAPDPEALAASVRTLEKEAAELGGMLGAPRWDDDDYGAKLDVLLAAPPPLVSFTFGCPPEEQSPEALAKFQSEEIDKWWPIIKAAGIT